jgi:phage gp46-like protein
MVIKVNIRKGYSFPINNKDASYVLSSLEKLKSETQINTIYSDEATAYATQALINFFQQNNIRLQTA